MNKKKIYLGYCIVLLLLLVLHGLKIAETDWLFNGAITILCVGQLFSTAVFPSRGRNTSSRTLEQQSHQKTPFLSWKLFFLLVIPLIVCTVFIATLKR